MTAYETAQRVQEYIRDALPLFEPTTPEYNGPLCNIAFDTMKAANGLGPASIVPEMLQGKDVEFDFESPLHAAEDRLKSRMFVEMVGLIGQAAGINPSSANVVNIKEALRDAIIGSGTPTKWMHTERETEFLDQQQAEEEEMQQMMETMGQGAEIVKTAGEAAQVLTPKGRE